LKIFFQGEQENQLFICMPFPDKEIDLEGKFDAKFQKIRKISTSSLGERYNFKDVIRIKEEWVTNPYKWQIKLDLPIFMVLSIP